MKSANIGVRLTPKDKKKFKDKARRFGGHSHVLHEMIVAFNEDRITIKRKEEGDLYES